MEHLPSSVLEEETTRRLVPLHVNSVKDVRDTCKTTADSSTITWTKENQAILNGKYKSVLEAVKYGTEEERHYQFVDRFHSMPNCYLTLNGINLITGKRGTGKSTFAFIQMMDTYLEFFQAAIVIFLEGNMTEGDFKRLSSYKVLIFCCREVIPLKTFDALIEERCEEFVKKYLKPKPQPGGAPSLEKSADSLATLLRHLFCTVFLDTCDELRSILNETFAIKSNSDSAEIFGVILDDLGFVFNRVDSNRIKSEVRAVGKILTHLSLQQNIPVVLCDSVKFYYDEDSYEELKPNFPSLLFASVSDIFYMSKTDQGFFKAALLKSSKDLIPAETIPN